MAEVEPEELKAPVEIKKGDYSVHFFLEEARSIAADEVDGSVDPIVTVKVFGQKKHSTVKDDIGGSAATYWGEHFFIQVNNLTQEDVETAKVVIEVNNHSMILSDSLIGMYEMDVAYVYQQPKHALVHTWVALSNAQSLDYQACRGYLKFGCSIIGEGDEQVDLTVAEKGKNSNADALLPPHIKQEAVQLCVRLIRAEALPKMDTWGGTCEAYVQVEFGGAKIKTRAVEADKRWFSSFWHEDILIPVTLPCVSTQLVLSVWDYDKVGDDDIIGTLRLHWKDIVDKKYADYTWLNIYGAPLKVYGKHTDNMNEEPRIASNWRGRILCSLDTAKLKKPKSKLNPIGDPKIGDEMRDKFDHYPKYELRVQVYSGNAFPFKDEDYKVVVAWGDKEVSSEEKEAKNGLVDWYECLGWTMVPFPFDHSKETLPPNVIPEDIPDIFIYLVVDGKKICFKRLDPKKNTDMRAGARWIHLKPDKAIGKVTKDWEGGFLRMRVGVGRYGAWSEQNYKDEGWNLKPALPPQERKILRCNLYQCRSLPAADSDARADPYVRFYCGGNEISTGKTEKENNLNPMWYKCLDLDIVCSDETDAPPILVHVMDYDLIGDDDLMGMQIFNVGDADRDIAKPQLPKWTKLYMGKPGSEAGEILVSFNLFTNVTDSPPKFDIVPDVVEANVEINVLGLRDLKPALGMLPVNKAFIKFDLHSLSIPGEDSDIKNIETKSSEKGKHPNLNTVIEFDIKMPVDPLYCPSLGVAVYDNLFMGLSQPLLGTFSINLGEIFHSKNSRKERQKLIEIAGEMEVIHFPELNNAGDDSDEDHPLIKHEEIKIERKKTIPKSPKKQKKNKAAGVKAGTITKMQGPMSLRKARTGAFVKKPKYERDKHNDVIEVEIPDPDYYMPIGYDRLPGDATMHYRYFVQTELEDTQYVDACPFNKFHLQRGQERGLEDEIFHASADSVDAAGEGSNKSSAGVFKGLIRITRADLIIKQQMMLAQRKKKLNAVKKSLMTGDFKKAAVGIAKITHDDDETSTDLPVEDFAKIKKRLLRHTECIVRVYVLDAWELVSRDDNSLSDPYVKIVLCDKSFGDSDNAQDDKATVNFCQVFDINTTLPGASILKIQVYDKDDVFEDDLIGQSVIDLEDRFFSNKWMKLPEKPVETRTLYHRQTKVEQGTIRLWVDIIPKKKKMKFPKWDITPRPPSEFECRLIVWETDDVSAVDYEGASDLYVRAWVNNEEAQESDTHYRCTNGKGSFNWRFLFPLVIPSDIYRINIQLWDRDLTSFNDFIADATITFGESAQDAWKSNKRIKREGPQDKSIFDFLKKHAPGDEDKFWIQTRKRTSSGKLEEDGRIRVSFELVPKAQAEACPVGKGRDTPNIDPFLPPPTGRLKFSWNPCVMAAQMCGPAFRCKLCCCLCCIFCCWLCIMIGPMLIANLIAMAFGVEKKSC